VTLCRVAYADTARAFATVEDHTTLLQIGQPDVAGHIQNESAIQPVVLTTAELLPNCVNLNQIKAFMQKSAATSPALAWGYKDPGGGGICMQIAVATMGALLCYQDDLIRAKPPKLKKKCTVKNIVDACNVMYYPTKGVGHYNTVCEGLLIDFTIGQFTDDDHYEPYIGSYAGLKNIRPKLFAGMEKQKVPQMRRPTEDAPGSVYFEEWLAGGCGYAGDMLAVKHIAQDTYGSCTCERMKALYWSAKRPK